MGNAAFLLIPVAVAALGLIVIGIKLFLARPRPYDGVVEFRRGLDALSPREPSRTGARSRRRETP